MKVVVDGDSMTINQILRAWKELGGNELGELEILSDPCFDTLVSGGSFSCSVSLLEKEDGGSRTIMSQSLC